MASQLSRIHSAAQRAHIPLAVSLELTERCNFRCRHCYLSEHHRQLSEDHARALIEELAEMGCLFLTLTGGEPLVCNHWLQVLRRARELGFCVNLLTNGSLVDSAAANVLADLHVRVGVSLYSLDTPTFEGITGVAGSLADTLAGVQRLRARGVEVLLKMPIMQMNRGHVDPVRELAERWGADFETYTDLFARRNGDTSPRAWQVTPQIEHLAEAGKCAPWDEDRPLCGAGCWHAHITATGDVLGCGVLPIKAGNIKDGGFAAVWHGSAFFADLRRLRRANLEKCAHCDCISYCGRCHAHAWEEHGTLTAPSSYACERARGSRAIA